jgi:hypothetical protein
MLSWSGNSSSFMDAEDSTVLTKFHPWTLPKGCWIRFTHSPPYIIPHSGLSPSGFRPDFLLIFPYVSCPVHFILLDLITLIILDEEHKLSTASLYNFRRPFLLPSRYRYSHTIYGLLHWSAYIFFLYGAAAHIGSWPPLMRFLNLALIDS